MISYVWSISVSHGSWEASKLSSHDLDLLRSRDVIAHVTIGLLICGFVLIVSLTVSHSFWYISVQRYWGHSLDFMGSCDVIFHMTIRLLMCSFLEMVLWNHQSISHRCWDIMCQTLSQAYSHWKYIYLHYRVLGAKLGVTAFCNFVLVSAP